MEGRFRRSFDSVRIHADGEAAALAGALGARAFAHQAHVWFATGEYRPESEAGRRTLAHELTHVLQQDGARTPSAGAPVEVSRPGDAREREADRVADDVIRGAPAVRVWSAVSTPLLARINTTETAAVLNAGTVRGSGVQFYPLQVTSTRIGPVSGQGGLLLDERNRLSVIVGTGITLRRLCDVLLPLWNSAAPFQPSTGGAPVATAPLSRDELARGLLVYNRYYLGVRSQQGPSMTGFAGGLRFPLPVEIDQNGEGVVNIDLVRLWAGVFDPAWEPLLDQAASAVAIPAAASVQQDATTFLATHPDALSRGMTIGVMAITNPVQAQPFATEVFHQVGTGQFDLALAVMDNLVNSQVGLLASQSSGAGILGVIRGALAAAPPQPSPEQQQSLDRANRMLGAVAAVAARETPYFDWSTVPAAEREVYVMDRLHTQHGFSINAAAGIVGNLRAESGVLPSRIEGSAAATPMRAANFAGHTTDFTPDQIMNRSRTAGVGPRMPGIGLAQWTSANRRTGLFQQQGSAVLFDMNAQVDYLVGEIQANATLNANLTAAGVSVNDAADEVVYNFEIPGAILDGSGNKLPRASAAVQAVFAVRRANAQRALQAWQAANP